MPNARGEDHPSTKITEEKAKALLKEWEEAPRPRTRAFKELLAQRYDISFANVECIVYGKTWTHLPRRPT